MAVIANGSAALFSIRCWMLGVGRSAFSASDFFILLTSYFPCWTLSVDATLILLPSSFLILTSFRRDCTNQDKHGYRCDAHDLIFSFSRKVWSIVKRLAILGNFLQANNGGKIMIHLIWYIVVGLIAGVIAKSVMHVHMTIFWTIVLGIIGSIIGGAVTHMFSRPITGRFHPAGLIFSTLGAILVLYICIKLNIHFPRVL